MTAEQERFIEQHHAKRDAQRKAEREFWEARRKQLDHERYMRNRESRLKRQKEYYDMNRENILLRQYERAKEKYGTFR